jgi:hypothetical protein
LPEESVGDMDVVSLYLFLRHFSILLSFQRKALLTSAFGQSAIQARNHTTPPGVVKLYNSSQSAICAIWLFANIYFVNVMRAKVPALQFPVIMYSIFTNVSFTYGPLFQTIEQGEALVRQLLISFLSAFAISTAVSLFIIPISSRTVVQKEQAGYIQGIRGTLKVRGCSSALTIATDILIGTNGISLKPGKL